MTRGVRCFQPRDSIIELIESRYPQKSEVETGNAALYGGIWAAARWHAECRVNQVCRNEAAQSQELAMITFCEKIKPYEHLMVPISRVHFDLILKMCLNSRYADGSLTNPSEIAGLLLAQSIEGRK